MCWLLPGSFDCVCCPHTSVHRPSIACLAVFLCSPGALFLHALSGPSTICPFPPHGWSAPDGLPLLLRKQPIWAAGDTPHLMPVEQGLPWHPVATGLAGQAIPFIVAASHAHALPSAPFWFSVPAVLFPPPPPPPSPCHTAPRTRPAVPLVIGGPLRVLHEVPVRGGLVEDVVPGGPLDMGVRDGHHLQADTVRSGGASITAVRRGPHRHVAFHFPSNHQRTADRGERSHSRKTISEQRRT